ncbi:MAG: tryptophan 2,3-dioxygenase family protein [Bdellovibrionota bacterium]
MPTQKPSFTEPTVYGKTDLSYNDYLKIPELLELQLPQSNPPHHDELLFIIIHQAYELWFKLILHEMENAIRHMREDKILRAHHFMNRTVQILKLLGQQIHILETMTPVEFLQFRDRLMPASGFQSLQFREVEFLAGAKDDRYLKYFEDRPDFLNKLQKRLKEEDLRAVYYSMLGRLGFSLPENASDLEAKRDEKAMEAIIQGIKPIYQKPEAHLPLYLLSESLIEFDEHMALWREHHVRVVERIIGFKKGTGGSSGAAYLKSTTAKKCFPCLWDVRTVLEKY